MNPLMRRVMFVVGALMVVASLAFSYVAIWAPTVVTGQRWFATAFATLVAGALVILASWQER